MSEDEKNLGVCECAFCGERGGRAYVPGGWWDLPRGWFVYDAPTGHLYACSRQCAESYEGRRAEEIEKGRGI